MFLIITYTTESENVELKLFILYVFFLSVPTELHDPPEAGPSSVGDEGHICESGGASAFVLYRGIVCSLNYGFGGVGCKCG